MGIIYFIMLGIHIILFYKITKINLSVKELSPNNEQESPIPTSKTDFCWSPTLLTNNWKGRCTGR